MAFKASENLAEQIAHYVGEKIIQLELKPGERVLEARISEELGVSRSPVREALRILEKNRLVELIPRRGAKVTEMTPSYIEWLYDILEELYALTTRKFVENCSKEDLRMLHDALKKIKESVGKGDTMGYFNGIFEYASVGLAGAKNPLLEQMLLDLWPSNRRVQFASLSFRAEDLIKNVRFFQLATRYIEEGKAKMASQAIRDYAENEKAFALKILNKKSVKGSTDSTRAAVVKTY
ncbi:MAG: GntR family transcriptional regulator [Desulfobacteraceae bacterium]|nr:GntR family transcriptional regulator [Desulfobacteraceae bacterium]MBC2756354.1 GntR family transcriptional regulator [Desulfobacteraceae bacterium]